LLCGFNVPIKGLTRYTKQAANFASRPFQDLMAKQHSHSMPLTLYTESFITVAVTIFPVSLLRNKCGENTVIKAINL